jgi:predicted ATP-grasp superfamily ATP-dependent carboligase
VGVRVLVTADESVGTLALVRGVRAGGFEPWVVVNRDDTYVARSRAVAGVLRLRDPHEDPEGWTGEVAAAAERLEIDVVLPATEATLCALTGREERFAGRVVGTSTQAGLDAAVDKALLPELAARHGLQSPPTVEVDPEWPGAPGIAFPAIVKPARTVIRSDRRLVRGRTALVRDAAELDALAAREPRPHVAQPFVPGQLAAVSGLAWRGETLSALHQRSIRTWPPETGTTAYAETVDADRDLEAGIRGLLAEIGWSGIYNVQFLLADDGPLLIDLNPRVYGSFGLTLAAGQNLGAAWVRLLLGESPAIPPYRVGVGLRLEVQDVKALAMAARQGQSREVLRALRPRPGRHLAVLSIRDPAPALTAGAQLWRGVRRRLP